MNSTKLSRKDYINGLCSQSEYYGQFVTPMTMLIVSNSIEIKELIQSKEKFFNDISLARWDWIAHEYKSALLIEGFYSLAGAVCLLKESARQLIL